MKNFIKTLTIITLLFLGFAQATSAQCNWTIKNGLDCNLNIKIALDCGSGPTNIASGSLTTGSWKAPSINNISLPIIFCNCTNLTSCTIKISFDGGVTWLGESDIYCCPLCSCPCNIFLPFSSTNCCISNGCTQIHIDCTAPYTIYLIKPLGC